MAEAVGAAVVEDTGASQPANMSAAATIVNLKFIAMIPSELLCFVGLMPGGKVPLDTCSYLTSFRVGSQRNGPIKSPAAEAAGLMTLFIIKRGNWGFGNQILTYRYYYGSGSFYYYCYLSSGV